MITPPYLNIGDKISIVAPAGKIDQAVVLKSRKILEEWGLDVILGENMFKDHFSYSATDTERMKDFQRMLDNPSVKAIFCARGGYGTARIIDSLNFSGFQKNPKWIIGFSDITAMHSHILQNFSVETIHGTMATGLIDPADSHYSSSSLKKSLFGESLMYKWTSDPLSRKGSSQGILTGGNLALLCSLIGTSSDIETKGKLLFIEEIGEHLYRIDRMMVQLKRAGKLDGLAGLIIGGITDIPDKKEDFGKTAYEIVLDAVHEYDYPVAMGFPAGHQHDNRALIFGRKADLKVAKTTNLDLNKHI
ncbi:MAG: LD-carboxypeptidase [Ignavibacteriales bacterium]|nr:LD-carboxypeptidase [Ignavibacteriales bacterium]MCF8369949.1 LD-carboxypeptidase [Bacteroidales bacterium]MCF8406090.1 LD-carboxypeptidase [Bacteroidales bacterium]